MKHLMVRDGLLGTLLVGSGTSISMDLFNSIFTIKQGCSLFQATTFCFDDEEVTEDQFEGEPAAVDNVVPPANPAKSDGVNVLVEDDGKGDIKVEDGIALGTNGVGKNLESVRHNQGREGNVVRSVEQEDEGDDSVSGGLALSDGVTSRADGLEGKEEEHSNAGGKEKDPSPNPLDERGSSDSPCQIPNLENTIDEELDCRIRDTNGLEYFVEIVGDETIPRPLGEPTESHDDYQTLAVTRGLN